MWAYASATAKQAWRSPVSWVLLAVGTFTAWFAAAAAILALDPAGARSASITTSTAHAAGALLAIWLLGRGLEEDRLHGFSSAADATAPGVPGRLLGRWAGALASGAACALLTATLAAGTTVVAAPAPIWLLITSFMVAGHAGAWALVLGARWGGAVATLGALLLFLAGHLPWGGPGFLEGPAGRALAAWLPGPTASGEAAALGYTPAAVGGLLLLALAIGRPADAS
jgi:hypothetical protein